MTHLPLLTTRSLYCPLQRPPENGRVCQSLLTDLPPLKGLQLLLHLQNAIDLFYSHEGIQFTVGPVPLPPPDLHLTVSHADQPSSTVNPVVPSLVTEKITPSHPSETQSPIQGSKENMSHTQPQSNLRASWFISPASWVKDAVQVENFFFFCPLAATPQAPCLAHLANTDMAMVFSHLTLMYLELFLPVGLDPNSHNKLMLIIPTSPSARMENFHQATVGWWEKEVLSTQPSAFPSGPNRDFPSQLL